MICYIVEYDDNKKEFCYLFSFKISSADEIIPKVQKLKIPLDNFFENVVVRNTLGGTESYAKRFFIVKTSKEIHIETLEGTITDNGEDHYYLWWSGNEYSYCPINYSFLKEGKSNE